MKMFPLKSLYRQFFLLAVPLLVLGCIGLKHGPYRTAQREFQEKQTTDYLRATLQNARDQKESVEVASGNATQSPAEHQILDRFLNGPDKTTATFFDLTVKELDDLKVILDSPDGLDAFLAEEFELDRLLAMAYYRNQAILTADDQVRATLERYPQTAYLDDLLTQYNAFVGQLDTRIGPMRHRPMIDKSFPFPDVPALKGQIAAQDVRIARLDRELVVREIVTKVKTAFYDLVYVSEAINLNRDFHELLSSLATTVESQYKVGHGRQEDILLARMELDTISNRIVNLEDQRSTICTRINTLLNRNAGAPFGVANQPEDQAITHSVDQLNTIGIEHRQELRRHQEIIDKMKLMVELATRMTYPDPSQGMSLLEKHRKATSSSNLKSDSFASLRPLRTRDLADFGQSDAYFRELKANIDAMLKMHHDMTNELKYEIRDQFYTYEKSLRDLELFRDSLIPKAKRNVNTTRTAYENSRLSLREVINARLKLLDLQLNERRSIREYRVNLARLDQAVGMILPKRSLVNEKK